MTVTFKAVGTGDTSVDLTVKDLSIGERSGSFGDYISIESAVRLGVVNQNLSVPVSCATVAYTGTYCSYNDVATPEPVEDDNLKFKSYSVSLAATSR